MAATEWIDNYPGNVEPIYGYELAQKMESQARKFGLEILYKDIISVTKSPDGLILADDSGSTIECKALILATGASPVKLGIPHKAFQSFVVINSGCFIKLYIHHFDAPIRKYLLTNKLINRLGKLFHRLMVIFPHRIDNTMLHMILQDHLADTPDRRVHCRKLYEHLTAVTPFLHHAFD